MQRWSPRVTDLAGGLQVRRVLPVAARRAVGPFVFFDHFGPVTLPPEADTDVGPHPHIGLATLTYLFEGTMVHRDSTGAVQRIEPGEINWMTAGRGVEHSERTPDELRGTLRRTHGLQFWVALPEAHETDEPSFAHTPASAVAELILGGATLRVLVGTGFGATSPVRTLSPTLLVAIDAAAGAALAIPDAADERALYGVDQSFELDGVAVPARTLAVLAPGATPVLNASAAARIVLVGGQTLGRRFMSWNFVSSRRERIVAAREDWVAQRFPPVPGENEFVPLPSR